MDRAGALPFIFTGLQISIVFRVLLVSAEWYRVVRPRYGSNSYTYGRYRRS